MDEQEDIHQYPNKIREAPGSGSYFYFQAPSDGPAPATDQQIDRPAPLVAPGGCRLAAGGSILLGAREGVTLSKTTICRFCG